MYTHILGKLKVVLNETKKQLKSVNGYLVDELTKIKHNIEMLQSEMRRIFRHPDFEVDLANYIHDKRKMTIIASR